MISYDWIRVGVRVRYKVAVYVWDKGEVFRWSWYKGKVVL